MLGGGRLAVMIWTAAWVMACGSTDAAPAVPTDSGSMTAHVDARRHMDGVTLDASDGFDATDGFEPYFDSDDLTKFEFVGMPPESVSIEAGIVRCTGETFGYFYRDVVYRNFVWKLEFRFARPASLAPGSDDTFTGNSGYFVHVSPPHGVWPECLEVQGSYLETGDIFGLPNLTSGNDAFALDALARARRPVGDWNELVITSYEGALAVELNGELVNQSSSTGLVEGILALESEGAEMHWRNVLVKRTP